MEVNGGDGEAALLDVEEGCRTPTHDGCRLPEAKVPPPPPRKKPFNLVNQIREGNCYAPQRITYMVILWGHLNGVLEG
nr:hypothetical protein MTR_5g080040 [Ipomoea trifida]